MGGRKGPTPPQGGITLTGGLSLGVSSALRMMETLAQKQERAYERLYHWLQKYLHLHSHEQQNPASAQPDEDYLDEPRKDQVLYIPYFLHITYNLLFLRIAYSLFPTYYIIGTRFILQYNMCVYTYLRLFR